MAMRSGQPTSIGGMARNNGPGKSAGLPTPASGLASAAARSAIYSVSSGAPTCGGRKSIVPPMRVLKPSVGKRVMARIPAWPAVRLCQFPSLPAPSEVTTPMPVTTTVGRPNLSVVDISLYPSANLLDQTEAFAPPMTNTGHNDLVQIPAHRPLHACRVVRRKQTIMAERHGGQGHVHAELRFEAMTDIGTGSADGKVAVAIQKGALFAGGRLHASRA